MQLSKLQCSMNYAILNEAVVLHYASNLLSAQFRKSVLLKNINIFYLYDHG